MKEFISKNFSVLFIGLLIIFLWSKGIFTPAKSTEPQIIRDTTYFIGQAPVQQYQPPTLISIPPQVIPQQYTPDTSYKGILRQYQELLSQYLSKNVTQDTLRLKDSTGREFASVPLEDTVTTNKIANRKWSYSYSLPVITNTVIQPYKPKNQLYYGFEITSPISGMLGIQQVDAGLIFKNKKDNILKAKVGYNFPLNTPTVSLGYYPKISFK
jgi:hypothetical protein